MQGGSYLFCGMIALICFMNMANTLIGTAITRKQEFGVLQAVGMTNAQLSYSIQLEGMLISLGTVLIASLAGIPLGYAGFLYGKNNHWIGMYRYQFPLVEIGAMFLFLGILQGILSFILSRNMKKESLVDRIRYMG
jgi:putative ABC transport system permease protein